MGLKKEKKGDTTIAKISSTILRDLPSLLAFLIVGTIIILILSKSDIPGILTYSGSIIIGFYFGQAIPKVNLKGNKNKQ